MLAGFVKHLPSACIDCTVPRFTVSCSRYTTSRDLLRFSWLSSDSVKCKGTSCVQGIEYAAQNRQKRKKPCAAFNTQHRAYIYAKIYRVEVLCKIRTDPLTNYQWIRFLISQYLFVDWNRAGFPATQPNRRKTPLQPHRCLADTTETTLSHNRQRSRAFFRDPCRCAAPLLWG